MTFTRLSQLALIAGFALCAEAQTHQGEPYFLVRIVRMPIRPEPRAAIEPYRASRSAADVIGMNAITGISQTWLIESHRSFSSIEATDKGLSEAPPIRKAGGEIDEEVFSPSTRLIGLFRGGLSYRPEEAIKLLQTARYFQVTIFRIRPGAEFELSELVRLRRAAFDSINLDRPEIGYQIISGSTSGMYMFLAPLPSMRMLDNGFARMPVYAEGLGPGGGKAGRQIAADADATREHLFFRVEPQISHVSDAFGAADPDFWRPAIAAR
jgi:hypothetical protein